MEGNHLIKNKFFMLITIGFLLVVTGCSTGETEPVDQAEDIEGLEVIEGQAIDYETETVVFDDLTLNIPTDTFELDYGDVGFPMIGYTLDLETGLNFNMVIEELPTELKLDLDDYLDLLQQNSDATIEYDNVEKVNVNGRVWAELTGTTEGYPLIQRVYVANKRAYVLSYGGSIEEFDKLIDVFDAINYSVEFVH